MRSSNDFIFGSNRDRGRESSSGRAGNSPGHDSRTGVRSPSNSYRKKNLPRNSSSSKRGAIQKSNPYLQQQVQILNHPSGVSTTKASRNPSHIVAYSSNNTSFQGNNGEIRNKISFTDTNHMFQEKTRSSSVAPRNKVLSESAKIQPLPPPVKSSMNYTNEGVSSGPSP